MEIEKLVKMNKSMSSEEVGMQSRKGLMKLFGLDFDTEHNQFSTIIRFFKGIGGRGIKPILLDEEGIAKILLQNKLVSNLEEGLNEAGILINNGINLFDPKIHTNAHYGPGGYFRKYQTPGRDTKYALQYSRYAFDD